MNEELGFHCREKRKDDGYFGKRHKRRFLGNVKLRVV